MVIAEADKKGVCEISQPTIAMRSGLKDRAVRNAVLLLESFEVITRQRNRNWSKRGRAADVIALATDRDFTLTKDKIMSFRSMGPTGTRCRIIAADQPAPDAGAPTKKNAPTVYKERARSVEIEISVGKSSFPCSTRVRFDRGRAKWRALLTVSGITMDLGRFDTQAEADAYACQAEADVRRTSTAKVGAPSFPLVSFSRAKMIAPTLGGWLFGDESESSSNGAGAAGALGQGAKLLAGLGGAHGSTEYDAARACATDRRAS
jgi:hypothetical protein